MTFNVFCSFCGAEHGSWAERLEAFRDILDRHDPDLVGLQELSFAHEVDQVLGLREGYAAVYFQGQSTGPLLVKDYPDSTILYRTRRFDLLDRGFYWLSPTPDVEWSAGFATGGQLPRLVAWARLREKEAGRDLVFVTTHFDNNAPSQDRSAPLFLARTEPWAHRGAVIVTGDFNSQPSSSAYRTLVAGVGGTGFHLEDAFDLAERHSVDSNQNPLPAHDAPGRIDHVFLAGDGVDWSSASWTVDLWVYGVEARYPSDHFPIVVTLRF